MEFMQPAPQHEALPDPIDLKDLARRLGVSELQAMRVVRAAERQGLAFSRIDSETRRLKWYWRDDAF